jgi:hypothetical protein
METVGSYGMTHRIAYLKPKRHIYTRTLVPFERSLGEIKKMLLQNGCSRIGTQEDMRGEIPLHTLIFEKDEIPYIIEFPIIYENRNKLRMDISGRIIKDRIKALLIEVEIGASPFTAAMVQFVAIVDHTTGRPVQMENYIINHQKEIPAGTLFLTGAVK